MQPFNHLEKQKDQFFSPFEFTGFDNKTYLSDFLNGVIGLFSFILGLFIFVLLQEFIRTKYDMISVFLDKYPLMMALYVPMYIVLAFALSYFMQIPKKLIFLLPYSVHKYFIKIPRQHQIGIDENDKLLIFSNEVKKFTLPFESIKQIKYSFNYVQEDNSEYKDMCNLKVILEFKVKKRTKKRILNATLRNIYFYKWEEFLKKLPSSIEINVS